MDEDFGKQITRTFKEGCLGRIDDGKHATEARIFIWFLLAAERVSGPIVIEEHERDFYETEFAKSSRLGICEEIADVLARNKVYFRRYEQSIREAAEARTIERVTDAIGDLGKHAAPSGESGEEILLANSIDPLKYQTPSWFRKNTRPAIHDSTLRKWAAREKVRTNKVGRRKFYCEQDVRKLCPDRFASSN